MRFVRVVLALAFGVAMVGPEAHECPVHDGAGHASSGAAASHHAAAAPDLQEDAGHQHTGDALCTCPQAGCPVGVGISLPPTSVSWFVAPRPTHLAVVTTSRAVLLSPRKHFLPFALAPPHTLA